MAELMDPRRVFAASAKKNLVSRFHNLRAIPSTTRLEDISTSQRRKMSCITKLLITAFCLEMTQREALALMTPLLNQRVSSTHITQIVSLLKDNLSDYDRRAAHRRKELHLRKNNKQTLNIDPRLTQCLDEQSAGSEAGKYANGQKPAYPTTVAELEKQLDTILRVLGDVEPKRWKQLQAAGLINNSQ